MGVDELWIPLFTHLIGKNKKETPDPPILFQSGYMPYHRKFEMVSEFVIIMNDVLSISVRYYYGAPYV